MITNRISRGEKTHMRCPRGSPANKSTTSESFARGRSSTFRIKTSYHSRTGLIGRDISVISSTTSAFPYNTYIYGINKRQLRCFEKYAKGARMQLRENVMRNASEALLCNNRPSSLPQETRHVFEWESRSKIRWYTLVHTSAHMYKMCIRVWMMVESNQFAHVMAHDINLLVFLLSLKAFAVRLGSILLYANETRISSSRYNSGTDG